MARKKRNRSEQRDVSPIANPVAARPIVSRGSGPLLSDKRLFHPARESAPVFAPRKSHKRIVESVSLNRNKGTGNAKRSTATRFSFAVPRGVDLCVRRKQRRSVLFALRRTGKGSRARYRRRSTYSGVSCK